MNSIADLLYVPNETFDHQKVPGFVQGKVVENNNSEFKGMVKIEFSVWEDGKNICEWARVLTSYSGKDYGTYIIPEIGEEVLVGFIGGSLKCPFLVGSLTPQDSSILGKNFDDKNLKKNFLTKGGIDIQISDEDSKQSITILTKKENSICLNDETESCTITNSKGDCKIVVNFKDGEIALEAPKKISLTAGKTSLMLEDGGGKIELKADSIAVNASKDLKLDGKNQVALKGNMVEISGNQTLKAKGGTATEIKGAMVKIN